LARLTWPDPDGYIDSADDNVLVIVMIEQAQAVENIDEIAATPGVDVLFVGPADLSFSLGQRGDQDHPKVREAIAKIVEAGKRHGKILGRPAFSPERVKEFQNQGFRLFMAPTELRLIAAGAKQYFEVIGKL
jgi:2-keto-3-deoxy-L-rhamnonate aldolase RhmA